ncbi:MAG TPA: hypothetical protein VNJ01_08210 [Bacteriovoracaceae bacterium]|nr:hypothetical protein [Bacteriovoracaceae bacterium]
MKNILYLLGLQLTFSSCSHIHGPAPANAEKFFTTRTTLSCDFQSLKDLQIVQPRVWGIEGMAKRSAASGILLKAFELAKLGNTDCADIESQIRSDLVSQAAATWDDYVILTIIKNHLFDLIETPTLIHALGYVADMTSGIRPGDHDLHLSSKFHYLPAKDKSGVEALGLDLRNALMQLSLDSFSQRNIKNGYSGVSSASTADKEDMAVAVAHELVSLSKTVQSPHRMSALGEKSYEFVLSCEAKLTKIFGNPGASAAVASGWDRRHVYKIKTLKSYLDSETPYPSRRFHMFSNMHVYKNLESSESEELFYLPSTCSTGGSGTGTRCRTFEDGECQEYKESFPSNCSKLGRFRNVNIMVSHISIQGRQVPRIKNNFGSTSIGYLAGPGGSGGHSKKDPNNGYAHSHIQLSGAGLRMSFSDALCRTE